MAEPQAVRGLREELTCPICLDIYKNPVSISCGHSFCGECIREVICSLRCSQDRFRCPVCNARAGPPRELQPNIQLRSIVQKFLEACEQDSSHHVEEESETQCEKKGKSSGQQGKEVLCDFCLEEPLPAVKTCVSCETSLCQAHLGKHSTKAFLKNHVLVEPCDARALAERRCPQHGKLLECYCVTDSVCICMLCCVASSHKRHKVISMEKAFGQAQSDFPETLQTLKNHEAAVNQIIENLLEKKEEIKSAESLQRNHLENLFQEMFKQLGSRKAEVLEAISRSEEQQLSQVQAQIQEHEAMKDAASRDVQELEALRDQQDPVLFTKEKGASP